MSTSGQLNIINLIYFNQFSPSNAYADWNFQTFWRGCVYSLNPLFFFLPLPLNWNWKILHRQAIVVMMKSLWITYGNILHPCIVSWVRVNCLHPLKDNRSKWGDISDSCPELRILELNKWYTTPSQRRLDHLVVFPNHKPLAILKVKIQFSWWNSFQGHGHLGELQGK